MEILIGGMELTFKTILFDLDGTLIDTNDLIMQSFQHTFEQHGFQISPDELIHFNGPPLIETFRNLDPLRAEDMITTYRTHNIKHHNAHVKAFNNALETIRTLHEHQFKLGIVTSKMDPTVDMGLTLTGIKNYFDTVVTVVDVENPKPHPEPVLKAMHELEGTLENTLMIGDSAQDIEAGQRAGVATVGVSWSSKGADFISSLKPTYVIDDLIEILDIVGVSYAKNR